MSERRTDLSLTPEEALSGGEIRTKEDMEALQAKIRSMANVQYPFVDVWSFNAALAWMVFSEDGHLTCKDCQQLEDPLVI